MSDEKAYIDNGVSFTGISTPHENIIIKREDEDKQVNYSPSAHFYNAKQRKERVDKFFSAIGYGTLTSLNFSEYDKREKCFDYFFKNEKFKPYTISSQDNEPVRISDEYENALVFLKYFVLNKRGAIYEINDKPEDILNYLFKKRDTFTKFLTLQEILEDTKEVKNSVNRKALFDLIKKSIKKFDFNKSENKNLSKILRMIEYESIQSSRPMKKKDESAKSIYNEDGKHIQPTNTKAFNLLYIIYNLRFDLFEHTLKQTKSNRECVDFILSLNNKKIKKDKYNIEGLKKYTVSQGILMWEELRKKLKNKKFYNHILETEFKTMMESPHKQTLYNVITSRGNNSSIIDNYCDYISKNNDEKKSLKRVLLENSEYFFNFKKNTTVKVSSKYCRAQLKK